MKRMGYRFELGSLVNALRRYDWFDEPSWRWWDIARGPRVQHRYCGTIDPRWSKQRFDDDMMRLGIRVRKLLADRQRLQRVPPDLRHLDDDWHPGSL
jgi:Ser/Thr protein kinase RdoA (MazF antagonist)